MKKYLIIVEKNYIKKRFKEIFESIKSELSFDIDIAVANNHILNLDSHIIYDLKDIEHTEVVIGDRKYPKNYRLICNGPYEDFGNIITKLVNENHYDAIVNACDVDDCGNMIFNYVIYSLGLGSYETKRMDYVDITDKTIIDLFKEFDHENQN